MGAVWAKVGVVCNFSRALRARNHAFSPPNLQYLPTPMVWEMVSPVAILFLLKNAPNRTSEHPYFQNFSGAMPPDPLNKRRLHGKTLRGRWASPTKRTTLKRFSGSAPDAPSNLKLWNHSNCTGWRPPTHYSYLVIQQLTQPLSKVKQGVVIPRYWLEMSDC